MTTRVYRACVVLLLLGMVLVGSCSSASAAPLTCPAKQTDLVPVVATGTYYVVSGSKKDAIILEVGNCSQRDVSVTVTLPAENPPIVSSQIELRAGSSAIWQTDVSHVSQAVVVGASDKSWQILAEITPIAGNAPAQSAWSVLLPALVGAAVTLIVAFSTHLFTSRRERVASERSLRQLRLQVADPHVLQFIRALRITQTREALNSAHAALSARVSLPPVLESEYEQVCARWTLPSRSGVEAELSQLDKRVSHWLETGQLDEK